MQLKFTKPRERRRQLKSQLETHSKLAELGAHLPRGAHPRSPGKAALLPHPTPPPSLCRPHPGRSLAHLRRVRWGGRACWQSCGINRGRQSPWKPLRSEAQGPADPSSDPRPSPPSPTSTGPTELHRLGGSERFIGPAYSPGPPTCTARPAPRPAPPRVGSHFKPDTSSRRKLAAAGC